MQVRSKEKTRRLLLKYSGKVSREDGVSLQLILRCSGPLRQDPLEAILVIFGRGASIFLFESYWKNMKNDTTFVRMRSGDHLGEAKMSKKGTSLRRI